MSLVTLLRASIDDVAAKRQARDRAIIAAHVRLRNEMIDALTGDPTTEVSAPGHGPAFQHPQAADVVLDHFAGSTGDADLVEMLRIVGMCSTGKANHEMHIRASALIAKIAAAHATFHEDAEL